MRIHTSPQAHLGFAWSPCHRVTVSPCHPVTPSGRRGVVLLVVLAMLTLFAVVAVSFVLFSEQEARSARLYKDAEHQVRPDPDLLLTFILRQMIYDTPDPTSPLVGQGLLTNMYGQYALTPDIIQEEIPIGPLAFIIVPYDPAVPVVPPTPPTPLGTPRPPNVLYDVNRDGFITFFDLNYRETNPSSPAINRTTPWAGILAPGFINTGLGRITDNPQPTGQPTPLPPNGAIDPFDLLFPYQIPAPAFPQTNNGWADGLDNDANGAVDDFFIRPFNGTGKMHFYGESALGGNPLLDSYYFINYRGRNFTDPAVAYGGFNPPYTYPDHNTPFLGAVRSDGTVLARSYIRIGPAYAFETATPNNKLYIDPYAPINYGFWTDPAWQPVVPAGTHTAEPWFAAQGNMLTPAQKQALVLRPIPWMHNGFPAPADVGGDVRNLDGVRGVPYVEPITGALRYAKNESIWVDPNFPIQTGPDGKRFKPLFAFFTMDLDGKINVNAHMNIVGLAGPGQPTHVSNQALGPHEVGPPMADPSLPPGHPERVHFDAFRAECYQLLIGQKFNGSVGRFHHQYGANPPPLPPPPPPPPGPHLVWGSAVPSGPTGAPATPSPGMWLSGPFYAPVDFSAMDDTPTQQRTGFAFLPGPPSPLPAPQTRSWFAFPLYPPGYDNSIPPGVRINHPVLYDPMTLWIHDRRIPTAHLELLYRYGGTNTDGVTSNLARLCNLVGPTQPSSLTHGGWGQNRLRWMLTTDSMDRTTYGLSPWFRPGETGGPSAYVLTLMENPPMSGTFEPFPRGSLVPMPQTPATIPNNGEFDAKVTPVRRPFQSKPVSSLSPVGKRFDLLNKPFQFQYPTPLDAMGNPSLDGFLNMTTPATRQQYDNAVAERQQRATVLYGLLREATGAADPFGLTPLTPDQINALRWLAQFAVNIVDYMDPDDYVTPFPWGAIGSPIFQATLVPNLPTGMPPRTLGGLGDPMALPPIPPSLPDTVFGTELPRVGINEAYIESTAGAADRSFNAWVELHNTFFGPDTFSRFNNPAATPTDRSLLNGPLDDGIARLVGTDITDPMTPVRYSIYRLVASKRNNYLRWPYNTKGDTDPAAMPPATGNVYEVVTTPMAVGGVSEDNPNAAVVDFTEAYAAPPGWKTSWIKPLVQPVAPKTGTFSGPDGSAPPAPGVPTPPAPAGFNPMPDNDSIGFYVVGPYNVGTSTTSANPTLTTPKLSFKTIPATAPEEVTILLRRLLCPHFRENDPTRPGYNPALPYNPYVTVDYVDFGDPQINDTATVPMIEMRTSWGRRQPYGGHISWTKAQEPMPARPMGDPKHSFFFHNADAGVPGPNWDAASYPTNDWAGPATYTGPYYDWNNDGTPDPAPANPVPFDWLVHMDRPLTSPLELLHVCGYKPHELTQQFIVDNNGNSTLQPGEKFLHMAPWFVFDPTPPNMMRPSPRLWRLLEFLENKPLSQWDSQLARRAGLLNINTIWEPEIFQGLVDLPVPQYQGSTSGVPFVWDNVTRSRDSQTGQFLLPGPDGRQRPIRVGNPDSRPFWNMAMGPQPGNPPMPPFPITQFPAGTTGLDETWMRQISTSTVRLMEMLRPDPNAAGSVIPYDHPYERMLLLTKIHNNVTTRSNVFAVWMTVGYFEVDDQGRLGAEIGFADGKHKRHRMFAIVDRSVFDGYIAPFYPTTTGGPGNRYATVDPRKDYTSQGGPPSCVLYWAIIE